jgi:hypothetical protein
LQDTHLTDTPPPETKGFGPEDINTDRIEDRKGKKGGQTRTVQAASSTVNTRFAVAAAAPSVCWSQKPRPKWHVHVVVPRRTTLPYPTQWVGRGAFSASKGKETRLPCLVSSKRSTNIKIKKRKLKMLMMPAGRGWGAWPAWEGHCPALVVKAESEVKLILITTPVHHTGSGGARSSWLLSSAKQQVRPPLLME